MRAWWVLFCVCSLGCGGAGDDGAAGSGGASGEAGAGTAGTTAAGEGAAGMAGEGSAGMDAAGTGSAGDAGGDPELELVPLPGGSRVHEHVLNLVDADAAAEIAESLQMDFVSLKDTTRKFYELYTDDYDFLVLILDHEPEDTDKSAFHSHIRIEPIEGTGIDLRVEALAYGSEERLKGLIVTYLHDSGGMPPFAHEVMHRWANNFDPSLGFGRDADNDYGPHWGMTSVHGALGGFDESTLRCETPSGAMPPDCTPEEDGRFRYLIEWFAPHTNAVAPYAPLELYLMGLIPRDEVQSSFLVLDDARFDPESLAASGADVVVEAAGISEIAMADIIALHGERAPATEEEKHHTSAWLLVSSEPAPEEQVEQVSQWAEVFGGHEEIPPYSSFEELTGGRATIETRLGERRRLDDPPYLPPGEDGAEAIPCEPFSRSCPNDLGCYDLEQPVCMRIGTKLEGELCLEENECAQDMGCSPAGVCVRYCDVREMTSPHSCRVTCADRYVEVMNAMGVVTGGLCEVFAGGTCDPLMPDCDPGRACYGIEDPSCRLAGTKAQGESCTEGSPECMPGTTCVAPEGSTSFTCQEYCSSNPNTVGDTRCDVRCPGNFLFVATWSVCLP